MRWLAIVILALVAPLAFLVWLRTSTEDRLSGLDVSPEPVTMVVSSTESFDPQGAVAFLIWSDPAAAAAPPWSGMVTGLGVAPGDVVETGDVVVQVDGIDRIAYQAESPLYRSLRRNDSGPDVEVLETLLNGWGFLAEAPDRTFTSATGTAVNGLGQSLGVARAGGVFDLSWLVWLGPDDLRVVEVEAAVGFPAPAPGTPFLVGAPSIIDAVLTNQEGRPLETEGARVMEVDGEPIEFVDGLASAEQLAKMSGLVRPLSEQISGSLKLKTPRVAFVVPSTALVIDETGASCVFVDDGGRFVSTGVTIGGGRASTVDIVDGLENGQAVLINPGAVIGSPTCR
jgi:hypothetical protein